jgi:hypothetical protein
MTLLHTASLAFCLALASTASARAGRTVQYAFDDALRLVPVQRQAAAVYVPDAVTSEGKVPLVVFLHGINEGQQMHLWMGGEGKDLRPLFDAWIGKSVVAPSILAAPSQTRSAELGTRLWQDFDLDAFVDATEDALAESATIDRTRVVVVGHSGAGCNDQGGLARVATGGGAVRPLAIVAIDTCMEQDFATALAMAPSETAVHVYWQRGSWLRPFADFRLAFEAQRSEDAEGDTLDEIEMTGLDLHNVIVPIALRRALGVLLPAIP